MTYHVLFDNTVEVKECKKTFKDEKEARTFGIALKSCIDNIMIRKGSEKRAAYLVMSLNGALK